MSEYLDVYLSLPSDGIADHYIQIMKSLHTIDGVTTVRYSSKANIINVLATWKDSELDMKVEELQKTANANVENVKINRLNKVTKVVDDGLKVQYDKLANDWRHFNTIVWGIPTVAIAIMATIIIAAYRPELEGWPRIASLGLGSLLLFALTVETVRKRHHMNAMSLLLKELQEQGLLLKKEFTFPVGISKDIEDYIYDRTTKKGEKEPDLNDRLFNSLNWIYARKFLTWTVFISAIVVALLSEYEFVRFLKYEPYAYMLGIVLPLVIFVRTIILFNRERKLKESNKHE